MEIGSGVAAFYQPPLITIWTDLRPNLCETEASEKKNSILRDSKEMIESVIAERREWSKRD